MTPRYNNVMRKEIILAILIGIGFGLFITFGVYQSQQSLNETQNNQSQDLVKTQLNSDDAQAQSQLAISSPEDELLTADEKLLVSGSTGPNNFVIIFVNNEETITLADESGNFSIEVALDEGANFLVIQSIDEDGHSCQVERTVIVNEEFLNDVPDDVNEEADVKN